MRVRGSVRFLTSGLYLKGFYLDSSFFWKVSIVRTKRGILYHCHHFHCIHYLTLRLQGVHHVTMITIWPIERIRPTRCPIWSQLGFIEDQLHAFYTFYQQLLSNSFAECFNDNFIILYLFIKVNRNICQRLFAVYFFNLDLIIWYYSITVNNIFM